MLEMQAFFLSLSAFQDWIIGHSIVLILTLIHGDEFKQTRAHIISPSLPGDATGFFIGWT